MLIDSHAHIYHAQLEHDLGEVITRARLAGVSKILMPATDASSLARMFSLCSQYECLYPMAALHPSDVKAATSDDFAVVERALSDPRIIAVGETGLDYFWDRSYDMAQQDSLRRHIEYALETDLPLVLHTRDKRGKDEVHRDIIRILRAAAKRAAGRLRGVFHCFGGPAWFADAAAELGFMLGIGGTVTFPNAGVDVLVRSIPLEQVLVETDAPYLAPVPYRGKRNEPAYVELVAEKIAEVHSISMEIVAGQTTENAQRLFRLA